jgi:hypothetical protein
MRQPQAYAEAEQTGSGGVLGETAKPPPSADGPESFLALLGLAAAAADANSLCHRRARGPLRLAGLHEPSSDGGAHARYEAALGLFACHGARGYPLCATANEDGRVWRRVHLAPRIQARRNARWPDASALPGDSPRGCRGHGRNRSSRAGPDPAALPLRGRSSRAVRRKEQLGPRPSAGAKRDFYLCPVPPLQRPSVPGEPFGSP